MLFSKKTPSFLAWSCVMLGLSHNLGAVLPEPTEATATPKATASANTAPADDGLDNRKFIHLRGQKDLTKVELGSDDMDVYALDLSDTNVFDLSNLPQYARLEKLTLNNCNNPDLDLSVLPQCKALRFLDLSCIKGSLDLTFLKDCNIDTLYIKDRDDLTDLNRLAGCTSIKHLSVGGKKLKTLDGIGALATLDTLDVSSDVLTTLNGLEPCKSLTYVHVKGDELRDVHALQNHLSLKWATISPFPGTNLEAFRGCTSLDTLRLSLCGHLETLDGFEGENIRSIHIDGGNKLRHIDAAYTWPKLEEFYLHDIHRSKPGSTLIPPTGAPSRIRFIQIGLRNPKLIPLKPLKNGDSPQG
ncbi:MAG: hypothetical protein ACPGUZ_00435 [Holosporaceae bacterium]